MRSKGSALVFSIILMAAITILGLAAFTLLYRNYQLVQDRNEAFFTELEEHVIAQEIYVEIVVGQFFDEISASIQIDGNVYALTYDNGGTESDPSDDTVTYDTGTMFVKINSSYQIVVWQINSNQEE